VNKVSGKRILLVDDDRISLGFIAAYLRREAYEVDTSENGEIALELLEENIPHLIICDVEMPVMGGKELRKSLRNNSKFRLIPFIFLSGKTDAHDIIEGLNLGVDDYVTKPVSHVELGARVRATLERQVLYEDLLNYDHLTGVLSRRNIESKLKDELVRVKRYGRPFSLIMVDIDHFKKINDRYGHLFGDLVLEKVAKNMSQKIRDVDYVGRMGGEEFVIGLPETPRQAAFEVAEKVRKSISEVTYEENPEVRVTISGGVSCAPDEGDQLNQLLEIADKKLYQAKGDGRNRIIDELTEPS
jgi:diguanylate cyclase (GGDEF)-like protein